MLVIFVAVFYKTRGIDELLNDAPLELAYNSYRVYHGKHDVSMMWMITQVWCSRNLDSSVSKCLFTYSDDIFPQNPSEADFRRKKRFCAYRNIVFYLYAGLKRRERHPLPACVYSYIQARFPPTDNEEDFADWRFSEFIRL